MATRPADLGLPGSEPDGQQYGEWSVRITVEADGVVLVAKDHPGSVAGSPVVYLGNPDSPGGSKDLLKRVVIRGLTVQSDGHSLQAGYVADRVGILVHQSQEVRLERVSVFGLGLEGIRFEGVMDSTIDAAVIGWCARPSSLPSPPDPLPYGLSIVSTRNASGDIIENSNAPRVLDTHVEFCELELFLDRGTRHVDFLGCQFEHGWGTASEHPRCRSGSPRIAAPPSTACSRSDSPPACSFRTPTPTPGATQPHRRGRGVVRGRSRAADARPRRAGGSGRGAPRARHRRHRAAGVGELAVRGATRDAGAPSMVVASQKVRSSLSA